MTKSNCSGCSENFYNGNNPYGVKECWCFKSAKIIKRKKVGMNDRPPWTWKPEKYPDCYHQEGYVFINCEKGDRQQ
jgi:hypothetical protein